MKLKKITSLILLSFLLLMSISFVSAQDDSNVTVYFFWGDGCPHCAKEKQFLDQLQNKHPGIEVKMYETWNNPGNADFFREVAQEYGTDAKAVPTTFIGEEYWEGYSESIAEKIESHTQDCIDNGCQDPVAELNPEQKNATGSVNEESPDTNSSPEFNLENDKQETNKSKTENNGKELCVHLFVKEDCHQCANVEEHLTSLEQDYNVDIKTYNVSSKPQEEIYNSFKEDYGLTTAGFPVAFIGERYFIGESSIIDNLEEEIVHCLENPCPCPLEKIDGVTPYLPESKDVTQEKQEIISIPLFGEINVAAMPIAVTTAIISFIDGFNPCSLWLITFLLGIVIYSNSRKKILTVGGTFLLVTGIAYALFMAGLLNVFLYIGYLQWIQLIVATIAFIFAAVNIKDYFWYKKGISFTIPDRFKPKIFKNMRDVMKSDKSFAATVIGTALLALGVVLVELPCTAGFPLIWTNMIAQNQIQGFAFVMLLLLYMVIYLSIEIAIILAALITMKATRFEEKHGRILKLVGGMIMLALALVMLIKPDLMNHISTTILIFGGAVAASFLLIWIHRKVLPKFGIKIGSEKLRGDNDG